MTGTSWLRRRADRAVTATRGAPRMYQGGRGRSTVWLAACWPRALLDTARSRCERCTVASPGAIDRVATDRVAAPSRVFHGWWIVLAAFVCHAVNTGVIFYTWGVFLSPPAREVRG